MTHFFNFTSDFYKTLASFPSLNDFIGQIFREEYNMLLLINHVEWCGWISIKCRKLLDKLSSVGTDKLSVYAGGGDSIVFVKTKGEKNK